MKELTKRTKGIIITVVISLSLLLNVGIHFNFGVGFGIFVTLDKLPMMLADRAVLCINDNRYDITDIDLVQSITKETAVATHTDLKFLPTDCSIEIYCGNVKIRDMKWNPERNQVIVYEADFLHWIFAVFGEGGGMVFLSDELIDKLNILIHTG